MIRRRPRTAQSCIWAFCDGGLGAAANRTATDETARAPGSPNAIYAGCGALIRDDGGRVLDWAWRGLPPVTNNEAEYAGLLLGIELARRQHAALTVFVLDSEVVVGQMQGRFAVNSRVLRPWHAKASSAIQSLPDSRFCLVPRNYNALADALAHEAGVPWSHLRQFLERNISTQAFR